MTAVSGFPPASGPRPRALILGSMPGAASLAAGEYYAHPRNSFWRILLSALGGGAGLPYSARLRLLRREGLALWDVLGSCVRPGSSDSAIERASMSPNDIAGFLLRRGTVKYVLLNGGKAAECYRRFVLPALPPGRRPKALRLPSTSPAYAALPYARKLAAWKKALTVAKRADI